MITNRSKLRRRIGGLGAVAVAAASLAVVNAEVANAAVHDVYLCARDSSASVADPNGAGSVTVPFYGFTQVGAPGDCATAVPLLGDPTPIRVTEGDTVNVHVVNHTGFEINFSSAGLTGVPDLTGVAATIGTTKTYSFTADTPGTYLYESDLDPRHGLLGLHGVVVVDPLVAGSAHGDAVSEYDNEQIVVISEVDLDLNTAVDPFAVSMLDYEPDLFLLNGQTHTENAAIPPVLAPAGNRVLLRYVNAAPSNSSMGALGLRQSVVGFDGEIFDGSIGIAAEQPQSVSQVFLSAGQTADAILIMGGNVGDQIPVFNRNLRTTATGDNGSQLMMLEVSAGGLAPTADIYFSIGWNQRTFNGVQVMDEDIAMWDGTAVSLVFDGSAYGLTGTGGGSADIDAVSVGASGNIYFSLRADIPNPGAALGWPDAGTLPTLEENDIFMWDGVSTITLYLDGADIGLNGSNAHDINALQVDESTGAVYFSTNSTIVPTAGGVPTTGGVLGARNEDVLVYTPGDGLTHILMDGQDFGLGLENIDGLALAGADVLFSLTTDFPDGGGGFDQDDMIGCLGFAPAAPGTAVDTCLAPLSLEFDGDIMHAVQTGQIDGYSVG